MIMWSASRIRRRKVQDEKSNLSSSTLGTILMIYDVEYSKLVIYQILHTVLKAGVYPPH